MLFRSEIHRILKPGGKALISTPNISMTLTRNPWHVREYTSQQLFDLASKNFKKIIMKGIYGNDKIKKYYDDNKKSVMKFKRLDVFNLEKYLPNFLYKIPYEFLNRMNRNKLQANDNSLVSSITTNDYSLENDNPKNLDLFLINGLRLEKSNEKDPTIKIIMKLISLIQKIKPKQIEIRSKFFFPSPPLRYLKI